ncbi:MAG: hypothetical protein HC841_03420 [Verrucomicrobiae bacterium]|nr:hypothetical protein [Verrucomicrobiae bacterium]
MRIYELAKKIGLESKEILAEANKLGIWEAKVPSSSLNDFHIGQLVNHFRNRNPQNQLDKSGRLPWILPLPPGTRLSPVHPQQQSNSRHRSPSPRREVNTKQFLVWSSQFMFQVRGRLRFSECSHRGKSNLRFRLDQAQGSRKRA